jgi:hypothetical protein
MLLNFAAPRTPVQVVQAPAQPATNIDALLNLAESQYSGLKKVGDTGYYYGNNRMYEPTSYSGGKGAPANMETFGGQNFVPVDVDITGFNKTKGEDDLYTYDPSMAYLNANKPRYTPPPPRDIMSFLQLPSIQSSNMNLQPAETSYGAGRFLNNGLMSLDFGLPSGKSND